MFAVDPNYPVGCASPPPHPAPPEPALWRTSANFSTSDVIWWSQFSIFLSPTWQPRASERAPLR
jgi:hypothetical protein